MHIRLWDLPTRLFHWFLVILVIVSAVTGANEIMNIHYLSGYGIFTLLIFRLLWGLWGSSSARFTQFVKGPGAIAAYARTLLRRQPSRSLGHNPLGALSVIALLILLATQVGFGLFAVDVDFVDAGPLSDLVSYGTASASLDYHGLNFRILLALIGLHLAVILFYRLYKREDLVTPMINGKIEVNSESEARATTTRLTFRSPILAVVTLGLAAALVWFTVSVLPKIL